MATTTDRLELHRFDMSDPANLETAVGTTIDEIDEQMVVAGHGLFSARPAAGIEDRFFYATDRGVLYYDDGSAWRTVSVGDDSITSAKIAADAVGSSEIAADAVGSSEIATGAVGTSELAADAVTTAKVGDNQITDAKVASPNNGIWKTIREFRGFVDDAQFADNSNARQGSFSLQASIYNDTNQTANASGTQVFYYDPDEYEVDGLDTEIRFEAILHCNNVVVNTGAFLSVYIRQASSSSQGGADLLYVPDAGANSPDNASKTLTPVKNGAIRVVSDPWDMSDFGGSPCWLMPKVSIGGSAGNHAMAAGSRYSLQIRIQVRNV